MIMISEADQIGAIMFFIIFGFGLLVLNYFSAEVVYMLMGAALLLAAGVFSIDLLNEKLHERLD